MVFTSAERAKRYREKKKSDSVSREIFLSKERERKRNAYIPILERGVRDQRKTRRRWRINQKSVRENKNKIEALQRALPSPPSTPNTDVNFVFPALHEHQNTPKLRGRNKVRKDRSKAYREITKLERKMSLLEKKAERYKKRYLRAQTRILKNGINSSPRRKTDYLLQGLPNHLKKTESYKNIRKQLIFHNSLLKEIKERYNQTKEQREKSYLSCLMGGKIVKKYRALRKMRDTVKCYSTKKNIYDSLIIRRKQRMDATTDTLKKLVGNFYTRDDNSKMLPGKKDTVTRRKVKEQKRLLLDTIQNIYNKFCFENPTQQISYASFCNLRPFWVVIPTISDRDTCLCKKHNNCQLMADVLSKEGVVSTSNLRELMELLVCDVQNFSCMYNECKACENKWFEPMDKLKREMEVEYCQWVNKKELRTKRIGGGEQQFEVKITVKEKISSSLWDLNEKFQKEMKSRFGQHFFNIRHQYRIIRDLKANLSPDEAILHVDFSENYGCKMAEEVQSIHFGASRNQITLHTGICYVGKEQVIPFCSISSSLRHDPVSIWAHLAPVLEKLAPPTEISTIHFISDGPTTQYRNKLNFYLASVYPFKKGYKNITWNFLEAGHGKGAADGVGGTIKRAADRLVSNGGDIRDAEDLFHKLIPLTTVDLFFIPENQLMEFEIENTLKIKTIVGTMKIHQLIFDKSFTGLVQHRFLSCFCSGTKQACDCFNIKSSNLLVSDTSDPESVLITSDTNSQLILPPITPDVSCLDKWCMVVYDDQPYPGIITDYDDSSVEIRCMSRIGKNRFFWPKIDDQIWYDYDAVIGLIPEPSQVTSRHVQVDKAHWEAVSKKLDLD